VIYIAPKSQKRIRAQDCWRFRRSRQKTAWHIMKKALRRESLSVASSDSWTTDVNLV